MADLRNRVFNGVMFDLRVFHCVDTNDKDVIFLVKEYIEEHYEESLPFITRDYIEPLVNKVVDDVVEDLKEIAYLKSQGKYKKT